MKNKLWYLDNLLVEKGENAAKEKRLSKENPNWPSPWKISNDTMLERIGKPMHESPWEVEGPAEVGTRVMA